METQRDYETEPILAVFRTTEAALDAIQRLRERLIDHHLSAAVRIIEPGESLELAPR